MFGPIKIKRAFELVEQEIREMILSGTLKPDEKLPSERELALAMQVARSVIREAFRILELSGLIYTKKGPNGGSFIEKPGAAILTRSFSYLMRLGEIDIDQLTEARIMIEKDVLQLVMNKNKSKADYKPADELIASALNKLKRGESYKEENFRFHTVLAELSQNPILIMNVESLMSIISIFVDYLKPSLEHSQKILESHKHMLEEMKLGNIETANDILEEHILFFTREFKNASRLEGISFNEMLKENSFNLKSLTQFIPMGGKRQSRR